MSDYKIITDSTCDLSQAAADCLDLCILPMEFTMDGKSYKNYPDEREITHAAFYQAMRDGKMPQTTQITTAAFLEAFEPVLEQGNDLLYLGFTSGLSATYERACMAVQELQKRYPECKIYALDTLCASIGEGFLAQLCAEQKQKGATIEEVRQWAEENRHHIAHWIAVDDLNHLKRGGRISTASAMVGGMLNIKPIIHIDAEGKLVPVDKVRGRRQSIDHIANRIIQTASQHPTRLRIVHGDALEDAQYLEQKIREKLEVSECEIYYVGPIIGSHTGPGMVAAVAYCSEK